MNRSETIGKLAEALSCFQGELQDAPKDSRGQNGSYASLDVILKICRPLLKKYKLSVSQLTHNEDDTGVKIETILMHASDEYISSTLFMPTTKILTRDGREASNRNQQIGSAITYGRRYAYSAILGITQADDDAEMCDERSKPKFNKVEASNVVTVTPKVTEHQLKILCDLWISAGYTDDKIKEFYKLTNLSDMTMTMHDHCMELMKKKLLSTKEGEDE